jgi:hypothetical protein
MAADAIGPATLRAISIGWFLLRMTLMIKLLQTLSEHRGLRRVLLPAFVEFEQPPLQVPDPLAVIVEHVANPTAGSAFEHRLDLAAALSRLPVPPQLDVLPQPMKLLAVALLADQGRDLILESHDPLVDLVDGVARDRFLDPELGGAIRGVDDQVGQNRSSCDS